MKISDIFRQNTSEGLQKGRDTKALQGASNAYENQALQGKNTGEDTVSISALSRKLSKVSNIVAEDEIANQDRIDVLKQKVANGEYQVSSEDVAQSFLGFIDEA